MTFRPDPAPSLFVRFRRCRRGSVIVVLGLLLPILAMAAVGVAEVSEVMLAKSKLQSYVDAAAIQGAGEFGVDQSSATAERVRLAADGMAAPLRLRWTITSSATVDTAARTVTVLQTGHRASFFRNMLPPGGWTIEAKATAIRTARKPLCVLGSQDSIGLGAPVAVGLSGNSAITANDCLVQSNANLAAGAATALWAGEVRASGSATGPVRPVPVTDAPTMADPFAKMRIDVPLLCDDVLTLNIGSGTTYLNPGVHCGELTLLGMTTIVLRPGEHYFVGPILNLLGQSTITGTDVVLIFKGLLSAQVIGMAKLEIEGRKSGPYAGFALITDRSYFGDFGISTNNARKIVGTIYLPNASLTVSGYGNRIADQSPWTVVVARSIRTFGSANLMINANYTSSAVPVPSGVGPAKDQPVRLSQ
ncbi:hypothetical protein NS228_24655 [Methylobacterium indicum]|uniref:pilus assembly protein TadG-related protein n=1 Tax=Methylobacterium indicum TaxID=1775910 RepID=UPI0007349970|nr:pilus assembly protein TadG-related protein [Methylobacterium indicum]KTS17919.1 hypothetical protein NS229_26590 [Methylobacterium indicum]KTS29282.1 hypothetical protein NS228_24655 [Methylobacterium indicum]KTS41065.1 hypothetical protein NS230_28690 [Methylobacterium indicum]